MRKKASSGDLEVRRRIATNLLSEGLGIREVARLVEASASSVKRWKDTVEAGGIGALEAKSHCGRSPYLSQSQKAELLRLLHRGPTAAGYATEQWTCRRVCKLIAKYFDVKYHPGHVWKLLRSLGWTWQKPEQVARERDEDAIRQWRDRDWPRIKKGGSTACY
jgi:transposase